MAGKRRSEFLDWLLERLALLGPVTARAMFGGYGIYIEDMIFGIVVNDVFYLKTDAVSRLDFEIAGCEPFVTTSGRYEKKGRSTAMAYFELPAEALEDDAALLDWARLGIGAALRARR